MKKPNTCNNCWLRGLRALDILAGFEDFPFCLLLKRNVVDGHDQCHVAITDEDIESAQREGCGCCTGDCRKCPESVIFDHELHGTVAFDSTVEGESKEADAERARDEAIIAACKGGINARFVELRKHDGSHCNHSWSHDICCWCGQEFGEDYADEDVVTDKLTCSNCSFASKSDVRVFPAGISSSFPLPGGVLYCPERDTRVPGTLEGCELHSERKKDDESNLVEVKFLDLTIDERFREMERLIDDGMQFGVDLASGGGKRTPEGKARHLFDRMGLEGAFDFTSGNIVELAELISEVDQLRKEAVITKRIRAERDALKVCNKKLNRDNKALRKKIALLDAQNKVVTRYAEVQDKNFEHRYEELEELKETVSSLQKELKTADLDRVATKLIFKCIAR